MNQWPRKGERTPPPVTGTKALLIVKNAFNCNGSPCGFDCRVSHGAPKIWPKYGTPARVMCYRVFCSDQHWNFCSDPSEWHALNASGFTQAWSGDHCKAGSLGWARVFHSKNSIIKAHATQRSLVKGLLDCSKCQSWGHNWLAFGFASLPCVSR